MITDVQSHTIYIVSVYYTARVYFGCLILFFADILPRDLLGARITNIFFIIFDIICFLSS